MFQDNLKGLTLNAKLNADTLADAVEGITNGRESQRYMYFIYRLHNEKVPLYGTTFDCYKYVKAVAGSNVEPAFAPNKRGLEYALSNQYSPWLFTDNVFPE